MFRKQPDVYGETPDQQLFVIYDSKVGYYREPMLAMNRFDIIRQCETLFRDDKSQGNQLVTNSEDFQIFLIGSYNKKAGTVTPCAHEHIANLHEIRTMVQNSRPRRVDPQQNLPMGIVPT